MRILTIISGLAVLASCASASVVASKEQECKCFPSEACWPSESEWSKFNATVGGRLIKTVPLGSPCHDPNYDAAKCEALTSQWKLAPVHIDSSSSVQAAIFANASCDVFTPRSSACLLGNYVRYAVNVTGLEDIAATIRFADKKNIRLVIRNTGHDYVGRSTGAGALSVWTHYLKGVEVKDWSDADYAGKAVKIGAGAQGFEILQAAQKAGLVVVTGECPTVGIGGGYTLSGGHSPLSTAFGLSADNTLEFEVVTADGKFVRASPSSPNYADLFWALSGGGAGNYGVVTSVTLRAHPDKVTSGASFTIAQPEIDTSAVINAWHSTLPQIIDSGTQATYLATTSYATVHSLSGYNRTQADIEKTLEPFIKLMAAMDITLKPNYTQFDSYHDHYLHYYGPLPAGAFGGAGNQLMGGRLLLRDTVPNVGSAVNATMQLGVQFIGQAQNVSRFANPSKRAVLPQWRDALVMSAYSLPYDDNMPFSAMEARQDFITDTVMPIVEKVTPNAGAYINEADYQQKDWQDVFYGSNYPRLLAVKKKYDPKGIFFNKIAVGSEKWVVRDDGRMCKA
ncbi:6-hydroxy-D-nicotine oxidase [Lentithecium fluviatile CBS 122367]|uniref:6-hydroxy-D-nicotine oxidase n=1 Tax=Lentithecium fluviatile CBS 122367 TaxID=1168545 RepID=A0A6G1IL45_9PLEO|nr:6-hydroxy-D-nicotine oxidase [Lentithecium fluviatile CBS 122367]